MKSEVQSFVTRRWSVVPELSTLEIEPLHGGLESCVALATLTTDQAGREIPSRFIVKQLGPEGSREADVYELLAAHASQGVSARLLGMETIGETRYVYLEEVRPVVPWPWSDYRLAAAVCRVLAEFHERSRLPIESFTWNYEAALADSAVSTLTVARETTDSSGVRYWRRLGDLTRVVRALPAIRSRLLSEGTTVIHGDVHPGNVILRVASPEPQVTLIDWGRARVGSPLEDVASWLHSLGCWEPEARRRHDTLLRAYLEHRGQPSVLTPALRNDYWFACASNGLSGAIRYHLAILGDPRSPEAERWNSSVALRAWERVIRRAAALVSTSRDRCM